MSLSMGKITVPTMEEVTFRKQLTSGVAPINLYSTGIICRKEVKCLQRSCCKPWRCSLYPLEYRLGALPEMRYSTVPLYL